MSDTPRKKKTSVTLPGSLKNLVHNVQNGEPAEKKPTQSGVGEGTPAAVPATTASQSTAAATDTASANATANTSGNIPGNPSANTAGNTPANNASGNNAPADTASAGTAPAAPKASAAKSTKAAGKARTVTRPSGDDSWDLFLDLAAEYKQKDSQLATIYIDRDLKNVLDRLRSARNVKMPTTAILSAIVARFIFDHEQRIKDAIYGAPLI